MSPGQLPAHGVLQISPVGTPSVVNSLFCNAYISESQRFPVYPIPQANCMPVGVKENNVSPMSFTDHPLGGVAASYRPWVVEAFGSKLGSLANPATFPVVWRLPPA